MAKRQKIHCHCGYVGRETSCDGCDELGCRQCIDDNGLCRKCARPPCGACEGNQDDVVCRMLCSDCHDQATECKTCGAKTATALKTSFYGLPDRRICSKLDAHCLCTECLSKMESAWYTCIVCRIQTVFIRYARPDRPVWINVCTSCQSRCCQNCFSRDRATSRAWCRDCLGVSLDALNVGTPLPTNLQQMTLSFLATPSPRKLSRRRDPAVRFETIARRA